MNKLKALLHKQNEQRGLLWTEEDKEEFAQIVAQECIRVCYKYGQQGVDIGFRIEDHLGVPIIRVI